DPLQLLRQLETGRFSLAANELHPAAKSSQLKIERPGPRSGSTRQPLGKLQRLEHLHLLFPRRRQRSPFGGQLVATGAPFLLQIPAGRSPHGDRASENRRARREGSDAAHVLRRRPTATKLPLNPSAQPASNSSQATDGFGDSSVP